MSRNTRKVIYYTVLVYSLSFLLLGLYFLLGGRWAMPGSLIIATAYMFMPMTAALVVQKLIFREAVIRPLGISFRLNKWFLAAWLLPPVMSVLAMLVGLLIPGVTYSPEMAGMFERLGASMSPEQLQQMEYQARSFPLHYFWIALLQGLVAGITVNAVAGFGEELGWRGFLQKELAHTGFWKSSLIIGLIWGFWHAPVILQGHNYPNYPLAGVFIMVILTVLLSPIFSYIRLKAGSVIAAAIIHGSFNATVALSFIMLRGGNELTVGLTGLAGFIVLLAINLGIYIFDRPFTMSEIKL